MRCAHAASVALVVASSLASPALAQTNEPLAGLLLRFFSETQPVVTLAANPDPARDHAAHFLSQANVQQTLTGLNRGITTQLSTFPVGSSAGGFSFTFDESLGVYNRTTESFGPVFTERPLTVGKGKFSFAVNYQHSSWDELGGQKLRDGDMQFYLVHEDTTGDSTSTDLWFEGDLIRADMALNLTTDTTVFFASYGVAERFDVGLAVPVQSVKVNASILATIVPLATSADTFPVPVHRFPDGSQSNTFRQSGEKTGIGDILLRGKWNFHRTDTAALAAGTDLRLPTGDADNLLGSGATQLKLYGVAATALGRLSPRATLGYTLSSGGSDYTGEVPDEVDFSAGVDFAVHPKVTLAADYLGRTLLDTDRMTLSTRTFQYRTQTDPTLRTASFETPSVETGSLTLSLGSVGFKANPVGRLLIVGNLLFALGNSGLQDRVTPVFGIDYSF